MWRRFDPDGDNLTLREVWVRIKFLPRDSALALSETDGREPWRLEHYLLSDLWALQAKQLGGKKAPDHHPWRAEQNKRANALRTESKRAAFARSKARLNKARRSRHIEGG